MKKTEKKLSGADPQGYFEAIKKSFLKIGGRLIGFDRPGD
jgi:hypothetical protein